MRGFTLIELAIVIVIAAILAAVAIPIYQGIVDDSKWSEAKSAIGTVKTAMDTWLAGKGGSFTDLLDNNGAAVLNATVRQVNEIDLAISLGTGSLASLSYFHEDQFWFSVDTAAPGLANAGNYVVWIEQNAVTHTNNPSDQGYAVRGVIKTGTTVKWVKGDAAPDVNTAVGPLVAW